MNQIGILQGRLTESKGRGLQFFPHEDWENEFSLAEKIGFQALEWIFHDEANPIFDEKIIKKIKALCKKHGIIIPSVCGDYFMESPLFGGTGQKSSQALSTVIKQGSKIGIARILIPFLEKSTIKDEGAKKEVLENLKPCLEKAGQYNIELAFETSMPSAELKDFIHRFKNPLVKVYYDTGNCVTYFGDKVPDEIRTLGKLITSVHIKDRKFGSETSYPLGQGDANFKEIFKAFREIKFDGPFIIQGARIPGMNDADVCTRYLRFVKNFLQTNREDNREDNRNEEKRNS